MKDFTKFVYLAYITSLITFLGCIGYLFYVTGEGKGDRWAKKIEGKAKNILKENLPKKLKPFNR